MQNFLTIFNKTQKVSTTFHKRQCHNFFSYPDGQGKCQCKQNYISNRGPKTYYRYTHIKIVYIQIFLKNLPGANIVFICFGIPIINVKLTKWVW